MGEERANRIIRDYEFLNKEERDIIERLNQNWAQQEKLRKEYKSLMGKEL